MSTPIKHSIFVKSSNQCKRMGAEGPCPAQIKFENIKNTFDYPLTIISHSCNSFPSSPTSTTTVVVHRILAQEKMDTQNSTQC